MTKKYFNILIRAAVCVKIAAAAVLLLIAESTRRPGIAEDGFGVAEDMSCGDMTKEEILKLFPEHIIDHFPYAATFGDHDAHFNSLKSMATNTMAFFINFSDDMVKAHEVVFPEDLNEKCHIVKEKFEYIDLKSNIVSMIDNFRYFKGRDYSNLHLTKAVMCHESTIQFFNEIRKEFADKINRFKGDIIKIQNDKLNPKLMDKRPVYNSKADVKSGLKIALNDTWAYKVWITEYQLEDSKTYTGKMKIVIYDHFGLNKEDLGLNKPARVFSGIYDWFVLQHWKGFEGRYKPFITVIEQEFSFKGVLPL